MKTNQNPQRKRRLLAQLFLSTLYISAFTFGGGFVIITFMKRKFVDEMHWIDEEEMLDLVALAQSSPGAIAVNAAMLVGKRIAGMPGMLVALLGTILPPMVIIAGISFVYAAFAANPYVSVALKGMQAGVAAIIADVVFDLGGNVARQHSLRQLAIMIGSFIAAAFLDVNVAVIILAAAAIGVMTEIMHRRRLAK